MPSPTRCETSSILHTFALPRRQAETAERRPPYTGRTCGTIAVAAAVKDHATKGIMGSILYPTAILAAVLALQIPAPAQENHDKNQDNTPPPQSQAQPSQPQTRPAPSPDPDDHRFTIHPVEGGFVRLDMRTGELASCAPAGDGWSCAPGRDDRAALDREIAQLRRDNAVLKNALLERGVPLPDGMMPNISASTGPLWDDEPVPRPPQTVPPTVTAPAPGAPQGDEVHGIMTAVEKSWRRLVEMVTNLQRDLQKKE